jgi:hypothetical protein
MGRRVWIKHEEKTRRHQPGGGNENIGKVCRCCDVRPQRDLTIPRWPFRYPIEHPFSLFHAPKSRTVLYGDPFSSL